MANKPKYLASRDNVADSCLLEDNVTITDRGLKRLDDLEDRFQRISEGSRYTEGSTLKRAPWMVELLMLHRVRRGPIPSGTAVEEHLPSKWAKRKEIVRSRNTSVLKDLWRKGYVDRLDPVDGKVLG